MEECNCIIIDDTPNIVKSATISDIKDRVQQNSHFHLNLLQLNPKDEEFLNDEDGSIIMEKLLEKLDSPSYLKQQIHLIICDYELGDKNVNGFEIVRELRNKLRTKKEIILYSSNIEDVIKKIFDSNEGDRIQRVKDLVASKIADFCKKDEHLGQAIIRALKAETSFSSDKFIESEMFKYSEYPFKNIYDRFEGKTLGEVAYIITQQIDEGARFKRELITQLISYMVDIKDDD